MQMIYMKIFVFPVFVCILENAFENILRCLVRRKTKQRKNPHPKPTGIHQKGTTTAKCQPPKPTPQPTTSDPATHREPNPPPKSTQNPLRNPPKPAAQNQKSNSKSTKSHQFQPTGNN